MTTPRRGRATRRAFGTRTWLIVHTIDALLLLVDPRVRHEIYQALHAATDPYPVPRPIDTDSA